jgi:hypothetical protein
MFDTFFKIIGYLSVDLQGLIIDIAFTVKLVAVKIPNASSLTTGCRGKQSLGKLYANGKTTRALWDSISSNIQE